jgi:serine/threonine protein kinase
VTFLPDETVGRLRDVAARPVLPAGRYTLGRTLGRGGMGTVYAARDELLDRDVAVKVSNAPAPDSQLEVRLRREAGVLARLEHPGIVPVHDAGQLDDGRLFYVMKLVRGNTLVEHAARLDSQARVLPVFERVTETVAFAHAAGVVHRDLKPSNVMIGSFGEVLVLDWGVAKHTAGPTSPVTTPVARDFSPASPATTPVARDFSPASGSPAGATTDGTRIGTPGFMAPEQARGDAAGVGPPADVYGLGALLFWMLTRHTAPAGADDVAAGLRAANPRVPKRLAAMIRKCLAPDPAARYPDAGSLAADLGRYRSGQAVSAHRETVLDRAERWFATYRAAILLVGAYLVMRTLFALSQRWR